MLSESPATLRERTASVRPSRRASDGSENRGTWLRADRVAERARCRAPSRSGRRTQALPASLLFAVSSRRTHPAHFGHGAGKLPVINAIGYRELNR